MNPEFEQHVRSCIPDESIYLHFGRKITTGRMEQNTSAMELEDGSLVTVVSAGRSVSTDGGDTWTEPDPVSDGAGNRLDVGFRGLVRLKSGRMGGFEAQSGHGALFRSSDDDGKSWSEPTRVGRRYNIRTGEPNDLAYMHSPGIVTSDGRLVAAVFVMLGHHIPRERGRAFWGDDVVLVGHHGYEQCLCMVWVYHSDDEGKTWQANEGTGIFKSGGELFITLDTSAGGHYSCEEPSIAEVSPGNLLLFHRTPVGRLFQSWSSDNGTTWSLPEPTALASSRAPAALMRIPGTDDLLTIWNQASADEIERGLQRHRLTSAISKDGGATWTNKRNIFSISQGQRDDVVHIEPPPVRTYRALEQAPRQPLNDIEGTYPFVDFWKDRAIIRYSTKQRGYYVYDDQGRTGYDVPEESQKGVGAEAFTALPISWFYE